MKNRVKVIGFIFVPIVVTALCLFTWKKTMDAKPSYRLNEPMLIAVSTGAPYYMIPANTVLHFKKGFDEGHELYTIDVFFKGTLPADKLSGSAHTQSTWLYQIDADSVSTVLKQYPLSKDDLVRILKARKMTREELAQIVRDWKDE